MPSARAAATKTPCSASTSSRTMPTASTRSNTDWPIRRSFPVFVMNAVKYLGGVRSQPGRPSIQPGQPSVLRTATPVANIKVATPRGDQFEIPREAAKHLRLRPHRRAGHLRRSRRLRPKGDAAVRRQPVRQPRKRPDAAPTRSTFGHEDVQARSGKQAARQELWKWLLLGAIGVLIFEWYIYNRRVYL